MQNQEKPANGEKPPMRRRLKNAALVLISQMLLVALAIAWLVHMILIAIYGSVSFIEDNPYILWGEIIASGIIAIFGTLILINQINRLGERRSADRERRSDRAQNIDTAPAARQVNDPGASPDYRPDRRQRLS